MAGRDPAFLYYDADVALDVAHMDRLERGCYFDLVQMYRKYHGYTMVQIRKILGNDYDKCWNAIELVLVYDESDQKYHVPWLRQSLEKKAQRNEKQRKNVQTRWDRAKTQKPTPENGDTMVIPSYDSGNTNSIPIIETVTETKKGLEDDVGGTGGEEVGREGFFQGGLPPATPLPGAMLDCFVKAFPSYPMQAVKDYTACLQLGYQLADQLGCPWETANNGRMEEVLRKWEEIVAWIPTSPWFHTKSLSFLNDKFQDLIQAKNNGKNNGSAQQTNLRIVKPAVAGNGHDPTLIGTTGFGEI